MNLNYDEHQNVKDNNESNNINKNEIIVEDEVHELEDNNFTKGVFAD
jgi:hypothetical protein